LNITFISLSMENLAKFSFCLVLVWIFTGMLIAREYKKRTETTSRA
jgi:hypothetical protein